MKRIFYGWILPRYGRAWAGSPSGHWTWRWTKSWNGTVPGKPGSPCVKVCLQQIEAYQAACLSKDRENSMTDPNALNTPHAVRENRKLVQRYADLVYAPRTFVAGETPVPVSGKVIGAPELKMMVEASLDGWLTTGRFNEEFEHRLAGICRCEICARVNSGSSANLVAFSTLTSPRLGERAIQRGR